MQKTILFISTCLLSGCTLLGSEEPPPLYTLKSDTFKTTNILSAPLAIDIPLSEASLNTSRIAITPSPYQRDYLADGEWPDNLPKVFHEALFDGLSQRWGGVYVNRLGTGLEAKYILYSEIQDFSVYHLNKESPEIRIRVAFKLVDMRERKVITAKTFSELTQASSRSMNKIVEAFNLGFHCLLSEALPWMETVFLKEGPLNPRDHKLGRKRR